MKPDAAPGLLQKLGFGKKGFEDGLEDRDSEHKSSPASDALQSASASSLGKALIGGVANIGEYHFPPDVIGGSCPRVAGEEEEIVWNAAAEACDAPVYIHPNTPSDRMIAPFLEAGLDGAIFGFGVETALHVLRLIVSGVFDRFPKLKVVIGHMGEALPYWLFRLDYMYRATLNSKRYPSWQPLRGLPSDYMRQNI